MIRVGLAALVMIGAPLAMPAPDRPAADDTLSELTTQAARPDGEITDTDPTGAHRTALGVQFHGTWSDYTRARRTRVLDRIRRSGATWVRMDVGWPMIQPEPGRYDLDWGVPVVDQAIRQVHRAGLKLLVMFWQTPHWAGEDDSLRVPPSDPRTYARAVGWAARRWADKVAAWEIWNEPNSSSFFEGASPRQYKRLLCPAYRAVHQHDSTARVVFGGTMYNDDDWIRRVYRAGAKGCFDVMATHPYLGPADAPPETADDGDIWTLRHVRKVRSVMLDFHDRKPIWATEFGWSAHRNSGDEEPWERGVSPRTQGRYAVRALALFGRAYPYVRKAFWYNERAKATGDPQQDGYGMLRRDLTPKPVYWAFRDYFRSSAADSAPPPRLRASRLTRRATLRVRLERVGSRWHDFVGSPTRLRSSRQDSMS